jgi:serine palmitoyltransferase
MSTTSSGGGSVSQLVEKLFALILVELEQRPQRFLIDIGLLFCFLYVMFSKSYKIPKQTKLSSDEVNELLNEWSPEPLIPKASQKRRRRKTNENVSTDDIDVDEMLDNVEQDNTAASLNVITSAAQHQLTLAGKATHVHNFATYNFLGLVGDKNIIAECKKTITKYGVGSCGPRGFYGTIDVHLELERNLSQWLGTCDTIVYSYGFCTISSVIPAFSKRGDVLIYDQGVNFATQQGIELSRSIIQTFKHNDTNDLERLLKEIVAKDKGRPVKNRRFIVINGVYENYGDIAPLKRIVELKNKYKFRLIMDDSFGIGVLGKHGRGTFENLNIDVNEIDALTANLENSFAAIGGFCTGSRQVVDHQRLAGLGYCFSASLPPYISTAAIEAVKRIEQQPQLVQTVAKNTRLLVDSITNILPECLRLDGSYLSPVLHIRYKGTSDQEIVSSQFDKVVEKMLNSHSVAIVSPKYSSREKNLPAPSIRLSVSAAHSEQDINKCVEVLSQVLHEVFVN